MNRIAGKPKELKRVNISLIMESIRLRESASRAEIVEDTNISHTTVRAILAELMESNDIVSVGLDESSGGRRAERYGLNTNKNYILSIVIEEKKLIYSVVNILANTIEEKTIKIDGLLDIKAIDNAIEKLMTKYKNIKAIGISVPGIVNETGYLSGYGMDDLKQIDINKHIENKYNIPVILENDLNAITLGFAAEYMKNHTNEDLNITYINFTSLGAGAGIMVNGSLVRGKDNFAGEIGFLPMGHSKVNELLLKNLNNDEYCNLVVNVIKIISCIINPKLIVLGGNSFRYDLLDKIKEKHNKDSRVSTEIIAIEDSYKSGLRGVTKLTLELINDNIKLVDKTKEI